MPSASTTAGHRAFSSRVVSTRKVPTLLLFWERSAKVEDQALVWGKAHGLLTDANAGETVTRADMVRALYQIWRG